MRILYVGTPEVALAPLAALIDTQEHEVVAVLTRPDAPAGRKRLLQPSPVKKLALAHDIPVLEASRLPVDQWSDQLAALDIDIAVVVAYGVLVPEALLHIPQYGWINIHFSLLPAWRGAAPVQHAIASGDTTTGVSIFQLTAGMDTGPLFATSKREITPEHTAERLLRDLQNDSIPLLFKVLAGLQDGSVQAEPQSEIGLSYAPKITTADARLDFSQDSTALERRIRALWPKPSAWAKLTDGTRIKFSPVQGINEETTLAPGEFGLIDKQVQVGTGAGALILDSINVPGKTFMSATSWWHGLTTAQPITIDLDQ